MVKHNNKKLSAANEAIVLSLKKYCDLDKKIPIRRARYIIAFIHRFKRPFNTRIMFELDKIGAIKLTHGSDKLEILV